MRSNQHDITHPNYSTKARNYSDLVKNLPTPKELIQGMYGVPIHKIADTNTKTKPSEETKEESHNQNTFDNYIENPLHLNAIEIEKQAISKHRDEINWDESINHCLQSIAERNKIDMTNTGTWAKEIHESSLIRTYTLLLNFQYAKSRQTNDFTEMLKTSEAALKLIDLEKTLAKKEKNLHDGQASLLTYFFYAILLPIYTKTDEIHNTSQNGNELSQLQKANLANISLYTTFIHNNGHVYRGEPGRGIYINALQRAIPAYIAFSEFDYLLQSLNGMLYESALSTEKWSLEIIEKWLDTLFSIPFNQLKEEVLQVLEGTLESAISVTINEPSLDSYYIKAVKTFTEHFHKFPDIESLDKEMCDTSDDEEKLPSTPRSAPASFTFLTTQSTNSPMIDDHEEEKEKENVNMNHHINQNYNTPTKKDKSENTSPYSKTNMFETNKRKAVLSPQNVLTEHSSNQSNTNDNQATTKRRLF